MELRGFCLLWLPCRQRQMLRHTFMLMNYYKGENTLYLRLSNSLWARGGTLIYLELFFRSFFAFIKTSICTRNPIWAGRCKNKRRQGHLRFNTEPKQSTKGRRQLPGNTIPITAGSGVEQNINHFQLHLTRVTELQSFGQTAVSHNV